MDRRAMIKVGLRLYGLPAFEYQKCVVLLLEKTLSRLPEGKEEILGDFQKVKKRYLEYLIFTDLV
ncbi:hypothetical protein HanRHA438_Chr00c11g0848401 [Helianthus annuus]|nr:hypothetical protein HanHA300_Chr07g0248571 [Helianthus annuus]KAJ0557473.1 hypothetical protein HanIR_Chr07g0325541 [Helianthus annuus]KAJ0728970.1 hypothetical protein HanLR1_Chr07g0247661 [Helianthus annuus]KAJ0954623.1 hypothetical protein HanRHA438_Chr00c11g0848401 [Helianthus annuus]